MSEDSSKNHYSSATHQRLQHSSTLNRRYVQRPEVMVKRKKSVESGAISSFAKCQAENLKRRQELAEKINQERLMSLKKKQRGRITVQQVKPVQKVVQPVEEPAEVAGGECAMADELHAEQTVKKPEQMKEAIQKKADKVDMPVQELAIQKAANARLEKTWTKQAAAQVSAKQMKEDAIKKAMRSMAAMESQEKKPGKSKRSRRVMSVKSKKRMVLAVVCAVTAVVGIGCFVATNLPTVSYGAMAIQSGIDLSKVWLPRGYSLLTSSAGEGILSVTYGKEEAQFVLTAERTSWDSKALMTNYVQPRWRSYDSIREQDTTIYISGSSAAWVSGGIKYTIDAVNGTLTNKQIKSIATSL